jgi:hypothetical protein
VIHTAHIQHFLARNEFAEKLVSISYQSGHIAQLTKAL